MIEGLLSVGLVCGSCLVAYRWHLNHSALERASDRASSERIVEGQRLTAVATASVSIDKSAQIIEKLRSDVADLDGRVKRFEAARVTSSVPRAI